MTKGETRRADCERRRPLIRISAARRVNRTGATHARPARRRTQLLRHADLGVWPREVQQKRGREVAARRVAADADLAGRDAELVDEVVIAGQCLNQLGGVYVLGREACREKVTLRCEKKDRARLAVVQMENREPDATVADSLCKLDESRLEGAADIDAAERDRIEVEISWCRVTRRS